MSATRCNRKTPTPPFRCNGRLQHPTATHAMDWGDVAMDALRSPRPRGAPSATAKDTRNPGTLGRGSPFSGDPLRRRTAAMPAPLPSSAPLCMLPGILAGLPYVWRRAGAYVFIFRNTIGKPARTVRRSAGRNPRKATESVSKGMFDCNMANSPYMPPNAPRSGHRDGGLRKSGERRRSMVPPPAIFSHSIVFSGAVQRGGGKRLKGVRPMHTPGRAGCLEHGGTRRIASGASRDLGKSFCQFVAKAFAKPWQKRKKESRPEALSL